MTKKEEPIIIHSPQRGIAESSYLGFEELRCLNISDKKGSCYPNYKMVKESGTTVTDLPQHYGIDASGNIYAVADGGTKLYLRTRSSGAWSIITGFGISSIRGVNVYKDHVFLFNETTIDVYKISTATWNNAWKTMASSTSKGRSSIISSENDALYIGAGRYVVSIVEKTGQTFDSSDTATYTYNNQALPLSSSHYIRSFEELGSYLLVGTGGKGLDIVADIFKWDMEATSYNEQIKINEDCVNKMLTVDNLTYVQAGYLGRWFVTNGTSVREIKRLPETLSELNTGTTNSKNTAVDNIDGRLFFDLSADSNLKGCGIYSLDLATRTLNFENIISNGEDGSTAGVVIGFVIKIDSRSFLVSWYDYDAALATGVDKISTTSRYSNDEAYLVSKMYQIGTALRAHTFREIQITLAKPLVTNDSVKIYSRTEQGGSWGDAIHTWNTVGEQDLYCPFGKTAKSIQFKIVLNNTANFLTARII